MLYENVENKAYHSLICFLNFSGFDNCREECSITFDDFRIGIQKIIPSTQRSTGIEVNTTSWDDIGGYDDLKKVEIEIILLIMSKRFIQAIEWPLKYLEAFQRMNLKPPKGILLYGPPGCSKTTMVKVTFFVRHKSYKKAIASSIQVTFLSLNGATIYSPFMGDAEASIREIFKRVYISFLVFQCKIGSYGSSFGHFF